MRLNNSNGNSSVYALGVLLIVLMAVASISVTVYGLYLAFSASIVLGLIVLFVEPTPFIIGLVMILCNKDLAQTLVDWFTK